MDEDENGIQLSLGLGCGGSQGKSKGKSGSSSVTLPVDADKGNKVENDIKSFFQVSTHKEESSSGSHKTDIGKTQENFFNPLSSPDADVNASINLNHRVLRDSKRNVSAEIGGERRSDGSYKRKMFFEDFTNAKKHEQGTKANEFPERKGSYISITTEDDSAAHNDDVADSEVEGYAKAYHRGSSGADSKHMNSNYRVPVSVQPANIPNASLSITMESNHVAAHGTSGNPLINMMQAMPPSKDVCEKGAHPINVIHHLYAGSYPPVLDNSNARKRVSQVPVQPFPQNTSESAPNDLKTLERTRGDGRQSNKEEGSSSHTEDGSSRAGMNLKPEDSSERLTSEGFSLDLSAIKPGIAGDVKFGGCGSCPNLPWVSTTAPGPSGKTISGVTYQYCGNQIKIVCACHGSHMSPDEFVRHVSEENIMHPTLILRPLLRAEVENLHSARLVKVNIIWS